MPLNIVRQDITKMPCDVIVNATDRRMVCDRGVAAAILAAAGEGLREHLQGTVEIGEVRVTPAFKLPCKYLFHVAGPVWQGGKRMEKELLAQCYKNVLKKAAELGATSVAVPLISSGSRGFPKELVLDIAVETIAAFLMDEELDVTLVVYDKNSYSIGKKLFGDIAEYISDNYVDENQPPRKTRRRPMRFDDDDEGAYTVRCLCMRDDYFRRMESEFFGQKTEDEAPAAYEAPAVPKRKISRSDEEDFGFFDGEDLSDFDALFRNADDSFAETLFKLIDARHMTELDCYKKANVSRQTWHKIVSDGSYRPSKTTVIAFAVALKLGLDETRHLLETVGFALSKSLKFDLIIEYCIENRIYDVFKINDILYAFDQVLLGV